MFANAARMLLSAIVLLAAILLTPLIFQPPAPQSDPVWSLRVMQTPDYVEVGDTISVEIVLLRNGLPAQIESTQPVIGVLVNDAAQDEQNPVLIVTQAVRGERTARSQRWIAEYTAVRPGPVRFSAQLQGVLTGEAGVAPVIVQAVGASEPIDVQLPQVGAPSLVRLMPWYFGGILALSLLAMLFFFRRQRVLQR